MGKFYDPISAELGLDKARDILSRNILWEILEARSDAEPVDELRFNMERKVAVIFGAGPSLSSDLTGLSSFLKRRNPVLISADGAVDALAERDLGSTFLVSDLDSSSENALKENSETGFVFAHAHGDNMDLVKKIVPDLGKNTLGTTQVEPRFPILNFGGFTDGDRACYIVASFRPSTIVLSGMDFGSVEGEYSVNRYSNISNQRRNIKMAWGKRSLEFLISETTDMKFLNVTKFGEEIEGARKVNYDYFT
jgi:uncharacterized Rossmann fold enzyme